VSRGRPARLLAGFALAGLALAAALALIGLGLAGRRPGGDAPPSSGTRSPLAPGEVARGAPEAKGVAGPDGRRLAALRLAPSRPGGPARAGSGRTVTMVQGLERALAAGDRAAVLASARALRAALIASPELAAEAVARLVDPAAPLALREALAAVLGSLPGGEGKAAVLAGLRDGALAGLERAAVLALGIAEPVDDGAFERDDQPSAVEVAPGLIVFVDGPVRDAAARAEMAARLAGSSDPGVRAAAARALRDSTSDPRVREALRDSVARETDPDAASESAAALASWAGATAPDDPERRATVAGLLDAAPGAPEAVRLRVAVPLAAAPLARDEEARLHALAASAGEAGTRRFAVDLVGRRLDPDPPAGAPAPAPGETDDIALLVRALRADPSPDVREAAGLALGRAAGGDPRVAPALATTLAADPDWEVRATAARSLAGAAVRDPVARAALAAAAARDPHRDVRAIAAESLAAAR